MINRTEAEILGKVDNYLKYLQTLEEDSINRKIMYSIESYDLEKMHITFGYDTKKWMLNPGGTVHGGIICTMFDISMGSSAAAFSGCYPPTVNLSVNYLSPIPNDDKVLVTCRVTKVGTKFVQMLAEAKIRSSGEICATASATFYKSGKQVI